MDSLVQMWAVLKPDLVVISGDLTQEASVAEFQEAQRFLKKLESEKIPYFVIPGNHDIAPVYRPIGRIRSAYKNYHDHISPETEQFYHDGELAIASINTVKRTHPVNGRVDTKRVKQVHEWFEKHPEAIKIVVTHHPLRRNHNRSNRRPCWRGEKAHLSLESAEVDIYLSGHHHRSAVAQSRAIEVHAGTVSERLKGEPPSFNVLTIDAPKFTITTFRWNERERLFSSHSTQELTHDKKLLPPPRRTLRKRIVQRLKRKTY
jgi:3',5'-cyclic AMP phosphodiesterase CpdA